SLVAKACLLNLTVLLTACGGGGGENAAVTIPTTPIAINSANAQQVSSSALGAGTSVTSTGNNVNGIVTAVQTSTTASRKQESAAQAILGMIKMAPKRLGTSQTAPGVVVSRSSNCTDGGTISGSFNDADNNGSLSTGDTLSITARNCNEAGTIMNGSISVSQVTTSAPTTIPFVTAFTFRAGNFSVRDAATGDILTMNGTMSLKETNPGIVITLQIDAPSLNVNDNGDAILLENFTATFTDDISSGAYTVKLSGKISSTALGGSVTIDINPALEGTGNNDPFAGEALITGANGASIRIIALDAVNVRMQIDLDGDGVVDETRDVTWAQL
ncbi:MAG: hypothetical protein D6698_14180, partial [Gammaproteobacteria bacterium]